MKFKEIYCPTCKNKFNYFNSDYRPFCCERCRLIDLGQWLNESYSVPVEKLTEDELMTLEQLVHEKISSDQDDEEPIQ